MRRKVNSQRVHYSLRIARNLISSIWWYTYSSHVTFIYSVKPLKLFIFYDRVTGWSFNRCLKMTIVRKFHSTWSGVCLCLERSFWVAHIWSRTSWRITYIRAEHSPSAFLSVYYTCFHELFLILKYSTEFFLSFHQRLKLTHWRIGSFEFQFLHFLWTQFLFILKLRSLYLC